MTASPPTPPDGVALSKKPEYRSSDNLARKFCFTRYRLPD
jgi:hypothetical protein